MGEREGRRHNPLATFLKLNESNIFFGVLKNGTGTCGQIKADLVKQVSSRG